MQSSLEVSRDKCRRRNSALHGYGLAFTLATILTLSLAGCQDNTNPYIN